jgi:hypothetical protein
MSGDSSICSCIKRVMAFCELICRHLLGSEVAASRNRSQKDVAILGQTGLAIDIAGSIFCNSAIRTEGRTMCRTSV